MPLKVIRDFINIEASSGIILLFATAAALLFANSPLQSLYHGFFYNPIAIHFANKIVSTDFLCIINDGLMTIFFLLVSLEIKRELIIGELNNTKKALLPGIAALGGMICPAIIYFLVNYSFPNNLSGWAIPTATDIAFSLGILSLLGNKIPHALKMFLTALAILDDLGAIIIIAIFYTAHISLPYLAAAALLTIFLTITHILNYQRFWLYGLLGALLWFCLLKAGIHATIAGVITGFAIPLTDKKNSNFSLLKNLETRLHPWVAFGILPLFALANAGLSFTDINLNTLLHPIVLGIALGLFFGKQIGVLGFSWLAVKLKFAHPPADTNWFQFYGIACLCGIGFTMSIFIGTLAFANSHNGNMEFIRLGVITSSCLASIVGYTILRLCKK